jgi:mRNA interferase MazF
MMLERYELGELVLLSFPYTDGVREKQRPALVLLDAGDEDILLARVTSQLTDTVYDASLQDWEEAGLLLPSVARLHKLATLEKQLVKRRIGAISMPDLVRVRETIRRIWL